MGFWCVVGTLKLSKSMSYDDIISVEFRSRNSTRYKQIFIRKNRSSFKNNQTLSLLSRKPVVEN